MTIDIRQLCRELQEQGVNASFIIACDQCGEEVQIEQLFTEELQDYSNCAKSIKNNLIDNGWAMHEGDLVCSVCADSIEEEEEAADIAEQDYWYEKYQKEAQEREAKGL